MQLGGRSAALRASLLLLLVVAVVHHLLCPVAANEAGFCLQGARNLPRSTEPAAAEYDAQFARGARAMPPAHPVLAAHDWPLSRTADTAQATSAYKPCHPEAPIFRYKVHQGVLYVDHDHHSDDRYRTYRHTFLEQLTLAMWLYRDFPDVDLVVDFTDHPQLCDQAIPFLRYSLFNTTALGMGGRATTTTHDKQQHQQQQPHYNTTELLSPAWVSQEYAARVQSYTQGFTIPSPEAWRDLSLNPTQFQDFASCMDSTHPWPSKQLKAFWRGQATGCSRGWPSFKHSPPPSASQQQQHQQGLGQPVSPAPHLLRNKRVQVALRLFPYSPQLTDVGISSLPRLTPECLGASPTPPAAAGVASGGQAQQQQQRQRQSGSAGSRRRRRMRRRRPLQPRQQRRLAHAAGAAAAEPGLHAGSDNAASEGVMRSTSSSSSSSKRLAALWRMGQQQKGKEAGSSESSSSGSLTPVAEAGDGVDSQPSGVPASAAVPLPRAYRGVASLLHREGIGLEGWASAALTLSIDGYGPPFRLPQQLLLGSPVLRMASPYVQWLDWHLVPGTHLQEFAYDLTDLEQQMFGMLSSSEAAAVAGVGGDEAAGVVVARLRAMAEAARAVVASRVHVLAQLDAFAWSVARYKQVCQGWEVQAGDGDRWRVLQLGPDLFTSKGVPEGVPDQVMRGLGRNFAQALAKHPVLHAAGGG